MPAKLLQTFPILCNPMDYNPQGSSVHGISQARILGWVSIPLSRGSSPPRIESRSPELLADSLSSEPTRKLYPHLAKKKFVSQSIRNSKTYVLSKTVYSNINIITFFVSRTKKINISCYRYHIIYSMKFFMIDPNYISYVLHFVINTWLETELNFLLFCSISQFNCLCVLRV